MKVHMGIAGQKSVAASFRPLHQWGVHAWASDSILDAKLVRGQFTLQTAQYALEQAETVRFATKSPQQSPALKAAFAQIPGSWVLGGDFTGARWNDRSSSRRNLTQS